MIRTTGDDSEHLFDQFLFETVISKIKKTKCINFKEIFALFADGANFFSTPGKLFAAKNILFHMQNQMVWQNIESIITYNGVILKRPSSTITELRKTNHHATLLDEEKITMMANLFDEIFAKHPNVEKKVILDFLVKYVNFIGLNANNEGFKIYIDHFTTVHKLSANGIAKFSHFYHEFKTRWMHYVQHNNNNQSSADIVLLTDNNPRQQHLKAEYLAYFKTTQKRVDCVQLPTCLDNASVVLGFSSDQLLMTEHHNNSILYNNTIAFLNELSLFIPDHRIQDLRKKIGHAKIIVALHDNPALICFNQDLRYRITVFDLSYRTNINEHLNKLITLLHNHKLFSSAMVILPGGNNCLSNNDGKPMPLAMLVKNGRTITDAKYDLIVERHNQFISQKTFKHIWMKRLNPIFGGSFPQEVDAFLKFIVPATEGQRLLEGLWLYLLKTLSVIPLNDLKNTISVKNRYPDIIKIVDAYDLQLFGKDGCLKHYVHQYQHKGLSIWSGFYGKQAALNDREREV